MVRTWPADAIERVRAGGGFDCDGFVSVYPKYECPYPLSDKYFLCSRMTMRPGQLPGASDAQFGDEMGIYLVDVFGNELLLHAEAPGCYDPHAACGRSPARRSSRRGATSRTGEGYFYVADVYRGTHMQGVPRGAVKSLRVVESPEKRHWSPGAWFGQGYTAPGMNWHSLENKRILGTVPVEEDGSASFRRAGRDVRLFPAARRERHDGPVDAERGQRAVGRACSVRRLPRGTPHRAAGGVGRVAQPALPLAWQRPPSRLSIGTARRASSASWPRCSRCSTNTASAATTTGKRPGRKLNLAPDRTLTFNTAYVELWRKGYLQCVGAGPAEIQPAYSWGSHASKLVQVLRKPETPGHEQLQLTPEELDRIITWVDLNGVYYPTYACAYPDSLTGRIPLDTAQLGRLGQLTGEDFGRQRSFGGCPGPEVSFDRPELSPLLAKFPDSSDPRYREALAIIQAGQEQLARRPRADMPGFVPSEPDQRREAKYALRRQIELRNREAIQRGDRVYDEGVQAAGR